MPLPSFNSEGELPEGVYHATLDEVLSQFGGSTPQRQAVTARLRRIYQLASATGKLTRLVIFGSYVTAKPDPNDVDVILIMADDFRLHAYGAETRRLFDHMEAEEEFGASIFWIRPSLLILETLETFIAHWQITRDGTRRGIVEVRL
jgi:predicted nucleotidyltransferase